MKKDKKFPATCEALGCLKPSWKKRTYDLKGDRLKWLCGKHAREAIQYKDVMTSKKAVKKLAGLPVESTAKEREEKTKELEKVKIRKEFLLVLSAEALKGLYRALWGMVYVEMTFREVDIKYLKEVQQVLAMKGYEAVPAFTIKFASSKF